MKKLKPPLTIGKMLVRFNTNRFLRSSLGKSRLNSVQAKLAGLFALLLGAVSLLIIVLFPAQVQQQAARAASAKAETIGTMAAFSIAAAMVFDDRDEMLSTLEGAIEDPDVLYIEARNNRGEVLAALRSPLGPTVLPEGLGARSGEIADGVAYQSLRPVHFDGKKIGDVYLVISTEETQAEIANVEHFVRLVAGLIFCVGVLLALIISRVVTGSLAAIAKTAQRIANGELSERAPVTSGDEVGQLAAAFNQMIDRVESTQNHLEELNAQLTQILDSLPGQVGVLDLDLRYTYVNPAAISDKKTREQIKGKTTDEFWKIQGARPDVAARTRNALRRCLEEQRVVSLEETVTLSDGNERHLICLYSPMLDTLGEVKKLIHYFVDVTDQFATEKSLREKEEQLLHSQKMEAIGRLAGGVAHDFNNLLTAITGHADLTLLDMAPDDPARADMEEIRGTVLRASRLTRQLLAFSRKQVLQARTLDLNEVVEGVEKMLRRLIGENIELQSSLSDEPGKVKADPGQLEQVIINLAVNARDAMPDGGRLTIETSAVEETEIRLIPELEPGKYVMLAVKDTGTGMDEHTRAHIFEPFFTTKAPGEGTGLGLATVYGIVKQSGGTIIVESEPDAGATFKIFLPVAAEEKISTEREPGQDALRGTETVLIVEDYASFLELARRALVSFGYTVLTANDPHSALRIAAHHKGPIHVLATDVVMPGMSGPEMVDKYVMMRSESEILFMSGYPGTTADCMRVLESGYTFLQKPFSPMTLIRQIRAKLDGEEVAMAPTAAIA